MPRIQKPHVEVNPVANSHAAERTRIIEASVIADDGKLYGCLIELRNMGDGLRIVIYRADPGVRVVCDGAELLEG